jgi:hypothetical protein
MIFLLIALPLAALALGFIAGFVGSTSGSRDLVGGEYFSGTITVDRPIMAPHRTLRSQGMDFPQTDHPTI